MYISETFVIHRPVNEWLGPASLKDILIMIPNPESMKTKYSQTPLIRPSLIRLNGSPPGNVWEQTSLHFPI